MCVSTGNYVVVVDDDSHFTQNCCCIIFFRKGIGHHEGLVRVLVQNSRPFQNLPTTQTAAYNNNNNDSSPVDDNFFAHPTFASLLVSSR